VKWKLAMSYSDSFLIRCRLPVVGQAQGSQHKDIRSSVVFMRATMNVHVALVFIRSLGRAWAFEFKAIIP